MADRARGGTVAERLSATVRPRASRSQAFLGDALGLSAFSVPAHNGHHGWQDSVSFNEGIVELTR